MGWVPAREPGRKAGFDREVEVKSFLCLLHAMAAPTKEEKQKLEDLVWKMILLTFHLTVATDFLEVRTLLNPFIEGSECLVHLFKKRRN